MSLATTLIGNLFAFIAIISVIVFIHEFGHFIVARLCKVKVEVFAIGFGKELFGFYDRYQTRWKFCLLPFGGYVKMFGDAGEASNPNQELLDKMTTEEKSQAFAFKNVYQRFAIVLAGPLFNFIAAIIILTFIFFLRGEAITKPIVNRVVDKSPAAKSGIVAGDIITEISGKKVKDFAEVRSYFAQYAKVSGKNKQESVNQKSKVETNLVERQKDITITLERQQKTITVNITPELTETSNLFDEKILMPTIGIISKEPEIIKLNIAQSFFRANIETYSISISIFKALKQLITGERSVKELGGPIKIAKYSGKTFAIGWLMVLWFMAMISINLGVMNLLPIPMLDGGHLFFYLVEIIFGKPVNPKTQALAFRIGFATLITLMIFTTVNDIWQILG